MMTNEATTTIPARNPSTRTKPSLNDNIMSNWKLYTRDRFLSRSLKLTLLTLEYRQHLSEVQHPWARCDCSLSVTVEFSVVASCTGRSSVQFSWRTNISGSNCRSVKLCQAVNWLQLTSDRKAQQYYVVAGTNYHVVQLSSENLYMCRQNNIVKYQTDTCTPTNKSFPKAWSQLFSRNITIDFYLKHDTGV